MRTAPRLAAGSAATLEDAVGVAAAYLEATTSPGHALGAGSTEAGQAPISPIGDVDEDGAPTVRVGVGETTLVAQAWRRRGPAALARVGGEPSAGPGAPNPHHRRRPVDRAGGW